MNFFADILELLQENADKDVETVLEGACPAAEFVSEDIESLGFEVSDYVNEAYIDYLTYKAESSQLMLECAGTVSAEKMSVIEDSINEGLTERGYSLIYRGVQAIKGFIIRLRKLIASNTLKSIKENIKKAGKIETDTETAKTVEDIVVTINVLLKKYVDFAMTVESIINMNAETQNDRSAYAKFSKEFTSDFDELIDKVDEKLKSYASAESSGEKSVDITSRAGALVKSCDSLIADINSSIKTWNKVVTKFEKMATNKDPSNERAYFAMHEITTTVIKYEGKILSAMFKLIGAANKTITRAIGGQNHNEKAGNNNAKEEQK